MKTFWDEQGKSLNLSGWNYLIMNLNKENILKDAKVTFENWVQKPDTLDNILDEQDNTLTVAGIASIDLETKIIIDLKSAKRILLFTAYGITTPANSDQPTFWTSIDGITWKRIQLAAAISMVLKQATTPVLARYILFWDDTWGYTYWSLGLRAYLLDNEDR